MSSLYVFDVLMH